MTNKTTVETLNSPKFSINGGKGFQMTFANGCTVSVQFGKYNYCEARTRPQVEEDHKSIDAEIAAFDASGKWITHDDWEDDVKGHCSTDEVAAFITEIAARQS